MKRDPLRIVIEGDLLTAHLPRVVSLDIQEAFAAGRVTLDAPALGRVVFDMSGVESLTSPGCGYLAHLAMAADGHGKQVAFNGATGTVDRVLRQVGVYRRFPASRPGTAPA